MLAAVAKFTDDAQALEKSLRLLQSVCTTSIGLLADAPDSAAPFFQARTELALGRRYFRLLKWYPCFTSAYATFNGGQNGRPLETILTVVEQSFLGMYFFLEMFTITNAIGITNYQWGPKVQTEADRSWAYAIIASILIGLMKLLIYSPTVVPKAPVENEPEIKGKKSAKSTKGKELSEKTTVQEKQVQDQQIPADVKSKIYRQLVIDCCDIFIPGASLGWIPVGPTVVGTAQFTSTVLAGQLIWNRVQSTSK